MGLQAGLAKDEHNPTLVLNHDDLLGYSAPNQSAGRFGDLHTHRVLGCMYSNPPQASYGVAPPDRVPYKNDEAVF